MVGWIAIVIPCWVNGLIQGMCGHAMAWICRGRQREEVIVEVHDQGLLWTPTGVEECEPTRQEDATCIALKTSSGRIFLVAKSPADICAWRRAFQCLFSYADALLWGIAWDRSIRQNATDSVLHEGFLAQFSNQSTIYSLSINVNYRFELYLYSCEQNHSIQSIAAILNNNVCDWDWQTAKFSAWTERHAYPLLDYFHLLHCQ